MKKFENLNKKHKYFVKFYRIITITFLGSALIDLIFRPHNSFFDIFRTILIITYILCLYKIYTSSQEKNLRIIVLIIFLSLLIIYDIISKIIADSYNNVAFGIFFIPLIFSITAYAAWKFGKKYDEQKILLYIAIFFAFTSVACSICRVLLSLYFNSVSSS